MRRLARRRPRLRRRARRRVHVAGTFAGFADTPARLFGVEPAGGAGVAAAGRASSTAAQLTAPGRGRPDTRPTPSLPASTTPASARSTPTSRDRAGPVPARHRCRGDRRGGPAAARTEVVPALVGARPRLGDPRGGATAASPRIDLCLMTLSGRGDKDVSTLRGSCCDEPHS